ncbi:hypothetical protein [Phytohabitans houttuyneae]|uniref:Uncharacterized protein n=1 Tax=Phytohabitans houttuyneae TaxID=1076126 RepID=A0A6V8K9P1_9ACTN|nr:hypothetical protein [Phytohabitans houttuyneae]GFJ77455.1 hypothetical protein Phou_016350 [Phytohabitans houttuyneae]
MTRRGPIRLHHSRLAAAAAARYLLLPEPEREAVRAAARQAAVRADIAYADLLAAEAALAARREQPEAARLLFSLSEDAFGASATLVVVYDRSGRQLWHVDVDEEWPDESLVTDLLADAWDWFRGDLFPVAAQDGDLFEFVLPDAVPARVRGTLTRRVQAGTPAGCVCRSMRDGGNPASHDNQIRAHGHCWCLCHGGP